MTDLRLDEPERFRSIEQFGEIYTIRGATAAILCTDRDLEVISGANERKRVVEAARELIAACDAGNPNWRNNSPADPAAAKILGSLNKLSDAIGDMA